MMMIKCPIRGAPLAKGYGTGTLKWGFNEVACERMEGTILAVQMALCQHWHLPSACLSKWCWRGHRELPICYTASTRLQWPPDLCVRQVRRVCSFSSMGSSFFVFTASSQPLIFTVAATAAAAFGLTRLASSPPSPTLRHPPSPTPQPQYVGINLMFIHMKRAKTQSRENHSKYMKGWPSSTSQRRCLHLEFCISFQYSKKNPAVFEFTQKRMRETIIQRHKRNLWKKMHVSERHPVPLQHCHKNIWQLERQS